MYIQLLGQMDVNQTTVAFNISGKILPPQPYTIQLANLLVCNELHGQAANPHFPVRPTVTINPRDVPYEETVTRMVPGARPVVGNRRSTIYYRPEILDDLAELVADDNDRFVREQDQLFFGQRQSDDPLLAPRFKRHVEPDSNSVSLLPPPPPSPSPSPSPASKRTKRAIPEAETLAPNELYYEAKFLHRTLLVGFNHQDFEKQTIVQLVKKMKDYHAKKLKGFFQNLITDTPVVQLTESTVAANAGKGKLTFTIPSNQFVGFSDKRMWYVLGLDHVPMIKESFIQNDNPVDYFCLRNQKASPIVVSTMDLLSFTAPLSQLYTTAIARYPDDTLMPINETDPLAPMIIYGLLHVKYKRKLTLPVLDHIVCPQNKRNLTSIMQTLLAKISKELLLTGGDNQTATVSPTSHRMTLANKTRPTVVAAKQSEFRPENFQITFVAGTKVKDYFHFTLPSFVWTGVKQSQKFDFLPLPLDQPDNAQLERCDAEGGLVERAIASNADHIPINVETELPRLAPLLPPPPPRPPLQPGNPEERRPPEVDPGGNVANPEERNPQANPVGNVDLPPVGGVENVPQGGVDPEVNPIENPQANPVGNVDLPPQGGVENVPRGTSIRKSNPAGTSSIRRK